MFGDWLHDAVRKKSQSNNLLLPLSAYRFASVNFYSQHRFIVGVWLRITVRDRVRIRVRLMCGSEFGFGLGLGFGSVSGSGSRIKIKVSVRIRVFSIVVNSC